MKVVAYVIYCVVVGIIFSPLLLCVMIGNWKKIFN